MASSPVRSPVPKFGLRTAQNFANSHRQSNVRSSNYKVVLLVVLAYFPWWLKRVVLQLQSVARLWMDP
jgi:hypothetical protein